MIITDVRVTTFRHTVHTFKDEDGHTHPGPPRQVLSSLLTIATEDAEGHVHGPTELLRPFIVETFLKKVLLGQNALMREKLWHGLAHWQRGSASMLTDRILALVDLALWDLAGRALGVPVYKLIGGYRDKVPAYASTMCGDEIEGGLKTPDDYARFADWCKNKRGYKAMKLHTWMPPVTFAPSVDMDIKACAAVREAVGPDFPLMLDASHWYSRQEALRLGRAVQDLGYTWFEEPMEEASISSYANMARELDIPVIGPEVADGKYFTRAEWIRAGACDILRTGVHDVGGLTPALKCVHLAESFNMACEVHGVGAGNLTLCAVQANGRWYERGLLHPHFDYDATPDYLHEPEDAMDADGFVHLSQKPGLGAHYNWDFITANTVSTH
ncbi:MAG TPA: enolase C-terminal domain-like protein [Beijerinckiaceae bacterium]|nr:enolase C-terminal domain-like protein [Beijerinckiaceae bacterium]